jgi:hypothetical protein
MIPYQHLQPLQTLQTLGTATCPIRPKIRIFPSARGVLELIASILYYTRDTEAPESLRDGQRELFCLRKGASLPELMPPVVCRNPRKPATYAETRLFLFP